MLHYLFSLLWPGTDGSLWGYQTFCSVAEDGTQGGPVVLRREMLPVIQVLPQSLSGICAGAAVHPGFGNIRASLPCYLGGTRYKDNDSLFIAITICWCRKRFYLLC